jgi:hypothetical protein
VALMSTRRVNALAASSDNLVMCIGPLIADGDWNDPDYQMARSRIIRLSDAR